MSRTVGVDLAVDPRDTAAAEITWHEGIAEVKTPCLKCSDEYLLELLSGLTSGDRAGIDCPFGWPTDFVNAIAAHAGHQPWPGRAGRVEHYGRLRLRTTDRVAKAVTGRSPLSASMDKLGATTARWAYLADQLAAEGHPVDRAGTGPVIEVYPAGARTVWGLAGERSTENLLRTAPWLRFVDVSQRMYDKSEHAFDALIAALVARAAALGLTSRPSNEGEERDAAAEGWIHIPRPDSSASIKALIGS